MAKEEAAPKTAKAPKPRLRHVKELSIVEPIHMKRGPTNFFQRTANTTIVADLDAQILTIKEKNDKSYTIPFCRAKYWNTDVGTVATK